MDGQKLLSLAVLSQLFVTTELLMQNASTDNTNGALNKYKKANVVFSTAYPIATVANSSIELADEALIYQVAYDQLELCQSFAIKYKCRECEKCSWTDLDGTAAAYFVSSRYHYDFSMTCTSNNNTNRTCKLENVHLQDGWTYFSTLVTNETALTCEPLVKSFGPKGGRCIGLVYGLLLGGGLIFLFLLFRHLHHNGSLFAYFPSADTRSAANDLGHAELDQLSFVSSFSSDLASLPRGGGGGGPGSSSPRLMQQQQLVNGNSGQYSMQQVAAHQLNRLKSVDAFRGISIVLMIFVNYGGGGYWYLNHSPWNGLTVADLVFPWFVFIMGVAIAITMKSLSGNELRMRTRKSLRKIGMRSLILFFLGLIVSNPDVTIDMLRIMGVLQRLAISYLFIATLTLLNARFVQQANVNVLSKRTTSDYRGRRLVDQFVDLVPFVIEWVVVSLLVLAWLLITFIVQLDDCPRGYLGPGGMQVDSSGKYNLTKCTGGVAGSIDRSVFGPDHTYQHPTARQVYGLNVLPYDPEGLLGCLTSIFLTFCGLHGGRIICIYGNWKKASSRLIAWAVISGVVGGGLCKFSLDGTGPIPINKNLWSLSFVLITAATAYTLLAILYVVVDVARLWDGAPFTYAGMNSLLLYMGHELLMGWFPFSWGVEFPDHTTFMLENVTACALWIGIAGFCYHVNFFFKV
ncbi:heparan-alpha-glucosaminide N-acetyltransferase-like [Convolutriloba macropyga]|uniref:heparan-alpha-glucosaminide N-acetyltransferase-like n=1 Tax=Convolutriloba macropyga TaxID=536237 RepID=UPI003F5278AC